MRVFYVHWQEAEAAARSRDLRAAGHTVTVHASTDMTPALKGNLPDVLVISLDRLPSHGRAIAEWMWEAKSRQHIPIVFEGGTAEKVEATRAKFPMAKFCASGKVRSVLAALATQAAGAAEPEAGERRQQRAKGRRSGGREG